MIKTLTTSGVAQEASAAACAAFNDVQERWNRAALHWDVEALTAIYTPDAVMYGGRPGMSIGHAGMRAYFSSYIDLLASTRVQFRDQYLMELAPGVYLAQGYADFEFRLTSGKPSGTTMRTTLVIVERDGKWQILQHHFSSTPENPPIPQ